MVSLIYQYVGTYFFQKCTPGRIVKGLVKYLRRTFHYNNCQRPQFHAGVKISYFSEKRIAPVLLYSRLPDLVKVHAQIIAMLLLFLYKKLNSINIFSISNF